MSVVSHLAKAFVHILLTILVTSHQNLSFATCTREFILDFWYLTFSILERHTVLGQINCGNNYQLLNCYFKYHWSGSFNLVDYFHCLFQDRIQIFSTAKNAIFVDPARTFINNLHTTEADKMFRHTTQTINTTIN